ncbi:Di-sulfide bridge nucleocytoplasmic transport domain-containing protein [Umbelopsis sp. AD052]|nr:Di-sulfide bridge nucleocytoplasmic transport domain-containing protein [Umbelopsis sp. AD052]
MYRSRAGPMDFEYDLKEKTASIFDKPAKEPLITEKTEIESGVKRTFSSAGLSTSSTNFTFQQSPKDVQPYVSGLGNPFLFALPKPKHVPAPPPEPLATQRVISPNAVIRARKRRAKEGLFGSGFRKRLSEIADERNEGSMSDSDSDPFDQQTTYVRKPAGNMLKSEANQLTPLNPSDRPSVPQRDYAYILSGYIQTGFNLFVVLVLMYLALQAILTIQLDVQQKVSEYSDAIMKEITMCTKLYHENRCNPADRVPAMDEACRNWETCIHRDPLVVGRAKVSAETFAEIINGFVDPISYKSMLFFLTLIFGSLILSNCAFGMYRSRHENRY